MLEKFFDPKSVAVIGASEDKSKVGFSLMSNLLGGSKREIYPVTLTSKEILGIPAFSSVLEIPAEIDLAVIAVKADAVPAILADCGKKNIPNAIIISSGFKEAGEKGKNLEDEISKVASEFGVALLGPNCLGVIDANKDFNVSFASRKPLSGKIAFLSQSGALGTSMLDWSIGEGVGFSKFISLGNEAQLTEIDFLKYLGDDPDTDAILVYLERIKDGREFMQVLSLITPRKPVIILKAGISARGMEAVMSHTGSLAPESSIFTAACKQAGAATVSSLSEFFNSAKMMSQGLTLKNPLKNLVILTNGGGPSVVAADLVDNSASISLVSLNEETKEKLRQVLPSMASVGNLVDIIGDALTERYEKALDIICEIADVEGVMVILTPQMMTEAEATAALLGKYKDKKKIFPVFIGGPSVEKGRKALIDAGLAHFTFPNSVVEGLEVLTRKEPKNKMPAPAVTQTFAPKLAQISFADTLKILNENNIKVSGIFEVNKENLEAALFSYGSAAYAMKAMSPSVVHKTEAGTVKTNISSLEEAQTAWSQMEQNIKTADAGAVIEGVLVQPMISGREVIIGMKRDAAFGPALLFGLGGIFTEAMKDTSVRIAPVSKEEALKMIREIKGIKILEGLEGEKPVNFEALADIISNLSLLALAHLEIKEIDLNPVIVNSDSAIVVDARIMI